MAFGFPAKFQTELELAGARESTRRAVRHAFNVLGWGYTTEGPDHFRVAIGPTLSSWGETLTVVIEAGTVRIESSCSGLMQIFDWGKNKRNVNLFLNHFVPAESRNRQLETAPASADERGNSPLERAFAEGDDDK